MKPDDDILEDEPGRTADAGRHPHREGHNG